MDLTSVYKFLRPVIVFFSHVFSYCSFVLFLGGLFYFADLISKSVKKRRDIKTLNYYVDRDLGCDYTMSMLKPWNGHVPSSLQKYHDEASHYNISWYQLLELYEISKDYGVDIKAVQRAIRESELHFCNPEMVLSKLKHTDPVE